MPSAATSSTSPVSGPVVSRSVQAPAINWGQLRLHVVTGKGGTGKTTIAGALALSLARGGRRVLVMEVEGRQGLAQLFDTAPLPYAERHVAVAPGGGEVWALAVDPEEALLEYLELFYKMRRAGSALRRIGAIEFATTIAPGMRDVLLTGKAMEATKRMRDGRPVYDAVVLDAPPTGRITRFLNVNSEVAGLAKVGPIKSHADKVMSVIKSPRTAVHFVSVLEEMPVQETVDGVAELHSAGILVGAVVVNMHRGSHLNATQLRSALKETLPHDAITASLDEAGLGRDHKSLTDIVNELCDQAHGNALRVKLETSERQELERLGQPIYTLPLLSGGADLSGVYELSAMLTSQGIA